MILFLVSNCIVECIPSPDQKRYIYSKCGWCFNSFFHCAGHTVSLSSKLFLQLTIGIQKTGNRSKTTNGELSIGYQGGLFKSVYSMWKRCMWQILERSDSRSFCGHNSVLCSLSSLNPCITTDREKIAAFYVQYNTHTYTRTHIHTNLFPMRYR